MTSFTIARSLLGKPVRVKLDERVITYGVLLSFAEDGEVVIEDETGVIHWCWPMLDIEEDNDETKTRQEDTAPFSVIS